MIPNLIATSFPAAIAVFSVRGALGREPTAVVRVILGMIAVWGGYTFLHMVGWA